MSKVLYFTRDYSTHDHRFLSALAGSPYQVYFLRLEQRGRQLEYRPLPPGVEQISWRGGQTPVSLANYPALVGDLRRVIRKVQPDVIHAGPVQSAAFLAALSGFQPLVSMSWGSDMLIDANLNPWMRLVTRYTLNRTTVMVADCQAVQVEATQFGFPADKMVLFPWGVDLQRFQPGNANGFRRRKNWQTAFVVLSLRSWEPLYGVDVLVRGFARAAQQLPNLRLLLLGGGTQEGLLRRILVEHGVWERVHFGGQVSQNDLPLFYQVADLYVSASHSDGSSVSLMEAMASGLPALVSDIPGNKEWITPGREGWLFKDGDDQAVTDGILSAYQQRERLPVLGQAARKVAENRADWQHNFLRLLEAYQLAINGRK